MDKKELRKDPIREKIFSFLSYVENNRNALYGIVAVVIGTILIGSYITTTTKQLNEKSSLSFGKAINSSVGGNVESSMPAFSELMESGSDAVAGNSLAYLIDYYITKDDLFKVDSLLNLGIKVSDDILLSKIMILRGDISSDRMEYDDALSFYKEAGELNLTLRNRMDYKRATIYYQLEDFDKSREIVEDLLEIENLPYDVKNKCQKHISMIKNKM